MCLFPKWLSFSFDPGIIRFAHDANHFKFGVPQRKFVTVAIFYANYGVKNVEMNHKCFETSITLCIADKCIILKVCEILRHFAKSFDIFEFPPILVLTCRLSTVADNRRENSQAL
jgi:hypothetical protein